MGQVISVKDWALVRRLVAEGVPQRQVARDLGLARETVRAAVASERPPSYERKPGPTSFDVFEPRVRALLARSPRLPASVIAERVGWCGSESWFRQNVARIRPDYAPVDPADRLVWEAGDAVQCDLWFPPYKIPLEDGTRVLLPVLTMVSMFSRFLMALMIPSRRSEDLLLGMWCLLQQLGGVPRRLIWDNETGIGRGRLSEPARLFAGTLACQIKLLKPRDPESKGGIERRNGWLESSFMPGREFASPGDFNTQLGEWLPLANQRVVRTTGAAPVSLLAWDREKMLPLPPAVFGLGYHARGRLRRDYYVSIAGNDYSADPGVIGQIVDVSADLEMVRIFAGQRLVGAHERRWARGLTVTDPDHVATAAALRAAYQQPAPDVVDDIQARDLAWYDDMFGLSGGWAA